MATSDVKSFEYKGFEFKPYSTVDPVYFMSQSKGLCSHQIPSFSHADFYEAARKVGAEKHNVFQLNNMLLIPYASHFVVCCQ